MITIKLGGFPFRFPQNWSEVSPSQAAKLADTKQSEYHRRLTILGGVPGPEYITLDDSVILAAYEVISFIEDLPDLTTNKIEVGDIGSTWSFVEFEAARRAVLAHQNEIGVCMYTLASIKGLESNFVEAGAKILDGMNRFLEQWGIFNLEEEDEPSALEEAAGIDRVQMFGVYSLLEQIAEKFGRLPSEIETQPVGWVYQQYHYDKEVNRFKENYAKLTAK